jgi:uncharacterized protein DUF6941
MAPEARTPKLSAMLICERVIREEGTGLNSLIRIFETITGDQIPVRVPSIFVYAKMTEAQGEYLFKLEVVRRRDLQTIAEAPIPGPISVDNPMATAELIIELGGLEFAEAGHYDFRLSADGKFIDSKGLEIAVRS